MFYGCRDMKKKQAITDADTAKYNVLYIGTYTEKESHVDDKAAGIYVYRMNMKTGGLELVNTSPATVNPSFIDISSDGKYLYSVNETGGEKPGSVSAFRLTDNSTKLEFINRLSSEGDYPCFVEADKKGRFVLIANYGTGNIALLPLATDGSLKSAVSVDKHEGRGPTSRQESAHAHCIVLSTDGLFAYSNDLGTDKIYVYKTGSELEPAGVYEAAPGSGPRHLAFHPQNNFVYSINELNGTIECLKRDSVTGMLTRFQTISTVAEGDGNSAGSADIHIVPSGEFLYATNRGSFNNIAAFRVNSQTGELTFIMLQPVKGLTPRNFAIDPSGIFLLVANQNSDQVVTFRIDPLTGRLIDTGIVTQVPTPVCLKFLPVPDVK